MRMRMDVFLQQRPELRMKLAPQIIQSIEILQLPTLELQQRIKAELLENPVLEMAEPMLEEEDAVPEDEQPRDERSDSDAEFEKMEQIEDAWRDYSSQTARPRGSDGEADRKFEAMQNTAARPVSLQDYLYDQFGLLGAPAELLPVAENIIYNIDDDGYLQYSLDEVMESMDAPCPPEAAQRALAMVQNLDPPGVGARDLPECLLLQMRTPSADHALARRLIAGHLDDLHNNRIPKVAKDTGSTIDEIKEAMEFISHLNPRPGAAFSSDVLPCVIPDVRVDLVDGEYIVTLLDDRLPRVYINSAYSRMLRDPRTSEAAKEYIRKRMQAARWLLDSIEQRRNTVYKITQAIVDVQRQFLDHGISHLVPLKMETIAQTTSVHVSTVCRAIADKYVQTPRGIYPLKFFFTGGTRSTDGTMHSRKSVKERVRQVIEKEDKSSPLSDDEVAARLQAEGLDIARRTVTKYRKAMSIPSSRRRRQY
ncbi:RNA polymerase factor sigma-54 [bacterium]|nr:RNA polymerase factor sigma-54 [bacterium]